MKTYKEYSWVSTLPSKEGDPYTATCDELGLSVTATTPETLQEEMEDAFEDWKKDNPVV